MTVLQRALRYIRGEGYAVRPLGGGAFKVTNFGTSVTMCRCRLLAFAGLSDQS